MNVIAQMEFELTYHVVIVQHIIHQAMWTPSALELGRQIDRPLKK